FAGRGAAAWKLRRARQWTRLCRFWGGGALGVPRGALILEGGTPDHSRHPMAPFLTIYSMHPFLRPAVKVTAGGRTADAGVGFLNGVLGGLSGLAGILTTIWCGMRGWPKDEQRAVFQPIGVAIFAMNPFLPRRQGP